MSATPGGMPALVAVLALAAWYALWLGQAGPLAALLPALPLAGLVPWLARGRRRAAALGALVVTFYCGFAVMELVANPARRGWAAGALALGLATLGLLMAAARRWRS